MFKSTIIAVSIGFGIPILLVMALVSRFLVHQHSKNGNQDVYTMNGDNEEPYQLPRRTSRWKQMFTQKQKRSNEKWTLTISGIVKAGDEGLWSSTLFTNPHSHPGEISFEAICKMFANELGPRSMTERSAYSGEIGKFLSSAEQSAKYPRRVQSLSYKRTNTERGVVTPQTQRKSLDISAVERGLGRSLSTKRPPAVLVPMNNGLFEQDSTSVLRRTWMKDGRPAEYYDGRTSMRLTPAELAALSLVLGSAVTNTTSSTGSKTSPTEKGAFGITISSHPIEDGKHQISLRQHKRSVSQLPCSGSGHSPLFAKYVVCGSLPFSQDTNSISSILITDDTFGAMRSGTPLVMRKLSQQTPQSKFLAALPHTRELTFFVLESSAQSSSSTPIIDAIAMLPFSGGLTPLATKPLIRTVRFIASGGQAPGRLLQRLEGLVDKVHRHAPHLNIFGPLHKPQNAGLLFRERERLGKIVTGAVTEELADKVARMQRYITLLERLMALVPDMKPQEVRAAVQQATKAELQRSYADAIAAYAGLPTPSSATPLPSIVDTHCPQADARSSRPSRQYSHRSPRSSLRSSASTGTNPGRRSVTIPSDNLGKQVETVLKKDVPFDVNTIATIARLVIVAWTLRVQAVAWEDGDEGFKVPDLESLPEKMILV